ncbi:MFS transporter [Bordetella bronchialis]|uniref:MFS transporter n=1 Tax=Bordetella bronchialis TaxID=463025 RepID=A0ABN4R171_9BORD|nr:MFS transporter [Bordetella bronchialis]ANN65448.1 MFS transporter [Bordetella bronchialis]
MRPAEALWARPPSWRANLTAKHWRTLNGAFLGWIFDGYEALALVVVLPALLHGLLRPDQMAELPVYGGLVIGITLLGWGIGGLVGGTLADYIGRKRMMMWSVLLYGLLTGLTAFAQDIWQVSLLRLLTGLAMGSEWSTGIALVAETWPREARAKGAGFLQSGFGWGTLLAALIWYAMTSYDPFGVNNWRAMFVLGAVPALFVLYLRRGVDESEQWIEAVRNRQWSATGQDAAGAGREPAPARQGDEKRPFTLKQLFSEREAVRRIALTTVLSIAAIVGWWAVSSWLPAYTAALGAAGHVADPQAWVSRVSISYTLGATAAYLVSGFIIDAVGRRLFLFLTFVGCFVTTLATYGWVGSVQGLILVAPVNGFFTLGCAFAWLAIYPSELFTATVRSTAVSFVFNSARLIAWVFPILSGRMIQAFGGVAHGALLIGCVYLVGLVLPWFLPETRDADLPR